MNLPMKQKQIHSYREQTRGFQGGGEERRLGLADANQNTEDRQTPSMGNDIQLPYDKP